MKQINKRWDFSKERLRKLKERKSVWIRINYSNKETYNLIPDPLPQFLVVDLLTVHEDSCSVDFGSQPGSSKKSQDHKSHG